MGLSLAASCHTVFVLLAISCTDPAVPPEQPNGDQTPEIRATDEIKITSAGATVTLKLDKQFRSKLSAALEKDARQTVRLAIRDIVTPAEADAEIRSAVIGVSLFLNKPDATPATSAHDPHHVGSAIFDEHQGQSPQSFLFDLRATMLRLIDLKKLTLDKPLEITIVPYLADGVARAPEKLSLPVKSLSITLPRRRR